MSSSEQLERETDEERARISETLDELRTRMTPGHVVDQLVDYATESSGGTFFRNLRQQAIDNPVPVALAGAALAWLAIAGRRSDSTTPTRAERLMSRTTGKVGAAGERLADRARQAADSASDTASKWSDQASDTASKWRGQAKSAAADLGQRGEATASNLRDTASNLQDTARAAADSAADSASSSYAAASDLAGDAASRVQGAARSAAGSAAEI